jgi:aspartate/methionine/tyrosine aminotransferase
MMKNFAGRIENMPTSIFATMSKKAVEYNAVNLGQGFPDFDGPQWIMDKAYEAMKESKNQYAPSPGILSLRKNLSGNYKSIYGIDYNPLNEIIVTAGATEALYSTITALIEKGDEVIIFEPFYDAYQANVILAGGSPVYVTLKKPEFRYDKEELEKAISDRTKMIIVNNPHNPTGRVFELDELQFIADLAKKHDLFVLSDEVYEFLTFDGAKHIPMASLEGMRDRTISISSTGKTFGMTGWKIGYCASSAEIIKAIQSVHQWVTFAVNTPGQHAMAYAFTQLDSYLPDFRSLYEKKRDLLYDKIKESCFKPYKPLGSYFMMVDIPEGMNDVDISLELVEKYKVAVIPPSVFYVKSGEGNSMLRLCFAKQDDTLRAGANILNQFSRDRV